ncbi:RING/FYVE/PHD zinc finger superfamily protein [Actinidia rufa]|uniref:RING/FYVE/PHD zinc finger superfamily protein n=1 Tax=Actinidia rufa TaxID=165716 RepID=A0A7J0G2F4_9ERIC|nr:RING/FYVE/PHD zinc finger superfamily protein [Actinidia rufa]
MDSNRLEARSEVFSAAIGELEAPPSKKARIGWGCEESSGDSAGVGAAMGRMRGGRDPTAAEMEMMVDAREKLVLLCGELGPKDVFPREGFGSVIEDIGLAAESQGASHFTGTLPLNKPNPAPNLSGRFPTCFTIRELKDNLSRKQLCMVSHSVKGVSPNGADRTDRPTKANSSGDATVLKTPAWSQRSQSTSSGHIWTSGNYASACARNNFVQSPLVSNVHSEIGKIVQKLLQPKLQAHPTWTPPPRDYMNKALNYQVCNLTIIEVEDVLVCDACEKGYHLKCLQSRNQKAIPKEKKVGTLGKKGNQQKITANGSSGLRSAPAGNMVNYQNPSTSGSNMPNASDMQVERSCKEKLVVKGWSPAKSSETIAKTLDHLQSSSNSQYNDQKELSYSAGSPPKQCHDNNLTVKDSERSDSKFFYGNGNGDIKQEEQGVARPEPVETSGTGILASEHVRSSSDRSDDVDWIGDIIQVVDGKTHYSSCCINGVVYKVKDYALFHFNNDKLMPSKLQARKLLLVLRLL